MRKFKSIVVIALAMMMSAASANAQTTERVHEQIYKSAYMIAVDTKEDSELRKVASFKVDAISYLKSKALIAFSENSKNLKAEDVAHINAQLDSMAYYMHEYVNLFVKEYAKAVHTNSQDRILKIFRDASIDNPLYKDNDKELTLAYYNRADYPTQFSLDTNWVNALAAVKKKLK